MRNRIRHFLLAGALLAAAATAVADNTITIQGGGDSQINVNTSAASNSLIDIYQVGTGLANKAGAVSPISQSGGNHTARIGQGATFAGGVWTPGSPVSNNSATISQSGAASDSASIFQATSSNLAAITQSGGGKTATVTQSGSAGNSATLTQSGSGSMTATVTQSGSALNSATLTQSGAAALQANIIQNGAAASTLIATQAAASAYTLAVTQGGTGGNSASLETTSGYNGSGLTVNQSGSANSATVSGMSGGSALINQTGTGGAVTLTDQSSGALTISQDGTNNALSIANYGTGLSSGQPLSVTQTGAGSASTTFTPNVLGIPYLGPSYTPPSGLH